MAGGNVNVTLGASLNVVTGGNGNDDGELRAADGEAPADSSPVQRYLAKAFSDDLAEVRAAMMELASR